MKKILTLGLLLLCIGNLFATHLKCGYISIEQLNTTSLTVRITVKVWTNTIGTNVLFGGSEDYLDFGDGSDPDGDGKPGILVPIVENKPLPGVFAQLGIATAEYTVLHTYPSVATYLVSYIEANRNQGVLNMDFSVNTRFYIESAFTFRHGERYQSPKPMLDPIFIANTANPTRISLASRDPQGLALQYTAQPCKRQRNTPVANYQLPSSLSISKNDGFLRWDNVFNGSKQVGEYAFAVRIDQYDKIDTKKNEFVGYMVFDFSIILEESSLTVPPITTSLEENQREIIVLPGQTRTWKAVIPKGPGSAQTTVEHDLPVDNFFVETYDSAERPDLTVTRFTVDVSEEIRRTNPYVVSYRVTRSNEGRIYLEDMNFLLFTSENAFNVITSVDDESTGTSFMSPNPVEDYLFVNDNYDDPAQVTVLDQSGKTVLSEFVVENRINLSAMSPGIYYVIISSGGKIKREKIVKN